MRQHRKNTIAATVAIALAAIATQTSAQTYRVVPADRPIVANNGEVEYRIILDPLYASTLEIPAKLKGYVRHALADSDFYAGNEELEEPTVRYLAYTLADIIHKKPKKILSWVGTEFRLNAKPKDIQLLLGQPGVVSIAEVDAGYYEEKFTFSAQPVSAAGDIYSGNEIIPWWKQYTNTNDSITTSNLISLIDGPINPVSSDLAFASINNGWYYYTTVDDPFYWGYWHATHVAGVIGAKQNDFLIRGINPGQPIMHYGGQLNEDKIAERFNTIAAYSELNGKWGVINLSFNNEDGQELTSNPFEFSMPLGRAMVIASNTNLIVQSAGNKGAGSFNNPYSYDNGDACNYSYSYENLGANMWDGIMVIGGHDINGQVSGMDSVYHNDTGYIRDVGGQTMANA